MKSDETRRASAMPLSRRLVVWFIAGLLAVPLGHQIVLALLHQAGVTAYAPFDFTPVPPLGVPQLVSLAFWGGVWGLPFAVIAPRLPRGIAYWLIIAVLGALGPTLVAGLVVLPLKGIEVPPEARMSGLFVGLTINAAWGLVMAGLARFAGRAG